MAKIRFSVNMLLLLTFAQFACVIYSSGESVCLSCPPVSHPRECTSFVEIWPQERCSTKMLLLMNDSVIYTFGYEDAADCAHSDSLPPARARERRTSITDIPLCHECCTGNLCNRKLCGIPESNNTNLACLVGNEVTGSPIDTSIEYCNEGEQCYAGRLHRDRPHQLKDGNYGCVSQVVCDHLMRGVLDGGPSTLCQKCCSEDGCNAHICHSHAQDPHGTTTLAMDTTLDRTQSDSSSTASTINTTQGDTSFTTSAMDTAQGDTSFTTSVMDTTQSDTSFMASTMDTTQRDTSFTTSPMDTTQSDTSFTTSAMDTTESDTMFTDCWDLHTRGGFNENGIYDIYPAPAHSRVRVRCDMTTDGGGWTILQKRYDGSLSFSQTFQEYEEGFGEVTGEHWLGLKWMHILTSQAATPVQLRVDLCTSNGQTGYAKYDGFFISGRDDTYRLLTGKYIWGIGIGDQLTYHNGHRFQTTGRCADWYSGGWWYHTFLSPGCRRANLNGGRYNNRGRDQGIVWRDFGRTGRSHFPSLRSSEMKIRPVNVTADTSNTYTCPA